MKLVHLILFLFLGYVSAQEAYKKPPPAPSSKCPPAKILTLTAFKTLTVTESKVATDLKTVTTTATLTVTSPLRLRIPRGSAISGKKYGRRSSVHSEVLTLML